MRKQGKQWKTLFWGTPKSLQMVTAAMKLRHLLLGRKVMTNLGSILQNRDITLATKVYLVKAMVFPLVTSGCESWTLKNTKCQKIDVFWTVVLEKTLENPLDCKEIQPVHSKGDEPSFFGGVLWRNWCWSWNSNTLATSCEEVTHWKRLWCWEG